MTTCTAYFKITTPDWPAILAAAGVESQEECPRKYLAKRRKLCSLAGVAQDLQSGISIQGILRKHLESIVSHLYFGSTLPQGSHAYVCNEKHQVFALNGAPFVFKAQNLTKCSTREDYCEAEKSHVREYVHTVVGNDVVKSHHLDSLVVPRTSLVFIERIPLDQLDKDPEAVYISLENVLKDDRVSDSSPYAFSAHSPLSPRLKGRVSSSELLCDKNSFVTRKSIYGNESQSKHELPPLKNDHSMSHRLSGLVVPVIQADVPLSLYQTRDLSTYRSQSALFSMEKTEESPFRVTEMGRRISLVIQEKLDLVPCSEVAEDFKKNVDDFIDPFLHLAHLACRTGWSDCSRHNYTPLKARGTGKREFALFDMEELSLNMGLETADLCVINSSQRSAKSSFFDQDSGMGASIAIYGMPVLARAGLYHSTPEKLRNFVRIIADAYGVKRIGDDESKG